MLAPLRAGQVVRRQCGGCGHRDRGSSGGGGGGRGGGGSAGSAGGSGVPFFVRIIVALRYTVADAAFLDALIPGLAPLKGGGVRLRLFNN